MVFITLNSLCNLHSFEFLQKEWVSYRVRGVTRNVSSGQADALINVLGNDLCLKPVTLFIRIRYGTWHMIHQQSTVTFTILMSSFSLCVSGFMPSETAIYGVELWHWWGFKGCFAPTKVRRICQFLFHVILSISVSTFPEVLQNRSPLLCAKSIWQSRRCRARVKSCLFF